MIKKILKKYSELTAPIKASLWFVVCSILQKSISFITIPIFTQMLTTNEYGLFNVYQSWSGIIYIFATLNLVEDEFNNGLLKYKANKDEYISSMQGLSTTITFCTFIIYLIFHNFWNNFMKLPTLLVFSMFAEIFASPGMYFWLVSERFNYKYRKVMLITVFMSLATPILGIIAIKASVNKGEAKILSAAFINICVGISIYMHSVIKGKKFFSKEYWKFALNFNIPLIPHYLSQTVLNQADRIMISNMVGTDKAGIYSVAYSAAMVMTIIIISINSSFIPWTYKKLKDCNYEEIRKSANSIIVLVAGITLFLICFAPEVIRIMAPVQYYEAIWVIPPVAASVYFMFLYTLFANVEFYFEETKCVMVVSVGVAILNIILNYFFIKIFGYIAAGYTTLFCYIIYCIGHFYLMKRACRKYMNNIKDIKIYNLKFIIILSCGFMIITMFFMYLYNFILIRYLFITIGLIIAFIKRNVILDKIKVISKKNNS